MMDTTEIPAEEQIEKSEELVKTRTKPFSTAYVLKVTLKNIRRAVDASIRLSSARIRDFDGDSEKSTEVFKTLGILFELRKLIDEFQRINAESFRNKRNKRRESNGT